MKNLPRDNNHPVHDPPIEFQVPSLSETEDDDVLTLRSARFNLWERAWREGLNERPSTDAVEASADENEITGGYQMRYNKLNEAGNSSLKDLNKAFSENEKIDGPPAVRAVLDSAKEQILTARSSMKGDLIGARERQLDRRNDLDEFRRIHHLQKAAHFPDSIVWHFALVFLIVLLESVGNMYFFAKGSDFGLLGGLLQAMVLSTMNVALGVSVGYFGLRQVNHKSIGLRVAGYGSLAIYIGLLLFLNLVAAHFRDLLSVDAETALQRAIPDTLGRPFEFSMDSLLLLLAGVLASGIALHKGYTADDPYPGYGAIWRRHERASSEYDKLQQALRERDQAVGEWIAAECRGLRLKAARQIRSLEAIIVAGEKLAHKYEKYRIRLENDCASVLKRYRDENGRIRVSPVPTYFSTYDSFPSKLDLRTLTGFTDRLETAIRSANRLAQAIDEVESRHGMRRAASEYWTSRFIVLVEQIAERRRTSPASIEAAQEQGATLVWPEDQQPEGHAAPSEQTA